MAGRCSELDVVEVVKKANDEGDILMRVKDIIEKLKERENCKGYSERTLYAKVNRSLERRLIIFDPHRGYIAVDPKHVELILKVLRLILCSGVTCEVLRDELRLHFETLDEMIELVEMALQHVITAQGGARRLIGELITAKSKEWYRLVDSIKVFYLRSEETGLIDGWCERCWGKPIDRELEIVLKEFIRTSNVMEKLGVPTIKSY
jgi:uncharacterized protein YbaR (Trm112 family)